MTPEYFVHDILAAGCNLEPCTCYVCGESEVIYSDLVMDGKCEACGEWQIQHTDRVVSPG